MKPSESAQILGLVCVLVGLNTTGIAAILFYGSGILWTITGIIRGRTERRK